MRTLLVALALLFPVPAGAATITLTAPTTPVTLPDGDDYATTVLGDPWDFDQQRDFLFEDRFSSVSVANGIWTGVYRDAGGSVVAPVFQGWPGALTAIHLDMPEFGTNRPVDADKYTELSYRMNLSTRSNFGISWTRDEHFPVSCGQFGNGCNPQAGSVADNDGYSLPGAVVPNSGWTLYDFDLKNRGSFLAAYGVDWAGMITGLQLQPSGAGAGTTLQFDWMRLVDPTTSPVLSIHWTTSGAPGAATVNIVVDGSGGCGGEVLARRVPNTGQYDLRTAKLPPGPYRIHLDLVQLNGPNTALDTLATSACSAPVTIAQAPILRFQSPSPTSGEDYATSELGNAWDMSDTADIGNWDAPFDQRWWNNATLTGGIFRATAVAPGRSSEWSDATILPNGPSDVPIDTRKYRYLTFRMWNDTSHFKDIEDYQTHGGGLRAIFSDMGLATDGTDGAPVLLYEDWHEYAVDLATMPGDPSDTNVPNLGWRALPLVTSLHIDPSEVQVSSDFAFDSIGLHADNCTADHYTVSWNLVAPDSSGLTVDLFADTDAKGADGVHLAGPLSASAGSGSADVDLGGLVPGSYYLYARVADTLQTRVYYSRVPVITPCADFSLPALVPQTGSWTAIADGYHASDAGTPALAVFPTLTGGARVSARFSPKPKASLTALLFAYKSPTDFSYFDVDARRGKVTAFHRTGNKRKRLRGVHSWLVHTKRGGPPVTVVLHVDAGTAELAAKGSSVLRLSGVDVAGAVGFGVMHPGGVDLTRIRGAALGR